MSSNNPSQLSSRRAQLLAAAIVASVIGSTPAIGGAQTALGTPFIGSNLLSFHTAENTRSGGAATTNTLGVLYGHRFGADDASSHLNLVVRTTARPFDNVNSGVLDLSTTVGMSQRIQALPDLSFAASTGVGLMAWSDDDAKTGRVQFSIPANGGVSYDFHISTARLTPFVMGSVSRYDVRTSLDDVQQTKETGLDTYYTTGASLRLKEVVLTSSRIVGEKGMPMRSRWTFSAGISF